MPTGEAIMVHLTDEQRQALQQTGEREPVPIYDARNGVTYYLLPGPLYERVRAQLEEACADPLAEVPPGIRRSKEAFLRDLPELMASWWYRGKWVVYHGDERIGVSRNPEKLLRKCRQRGLKGDEYHLDLIQHHEPDPEEVEIGLCEFDEADIDKDHA